MDRHEGHPLSPADRRLALLGLGLVCLSVVVVCWGFVELWRWALT